MFAPVIGSAYTMTTKQEAHWSEQTKAQNTEKGMYVGLKQPRGYGERYVTPARAAAKETSLVVEAARQEEEAPQVLQQPRSQDLYPGLGKGPGNEVGTGSTSRTQSTIGMSRALIRRAVKRAGPSKKV